MKNKLLWAVVAAAIIYAIFSYRKADGVDIAKADMVLMNGHDHIHCQRCPVDCRSGSGFRMMKIIFVGSNMDVANLYR